MDKLKASFEDVADWCEKHLEASWDREIGMTFGAMLRTYGRLATIPSRVHGQQQASKEWELNHKAEKFLFDFCTCFYLAYTNKAKVIDEPLSSALVNMTYDTGPQAQ